MATVRHRPRGSWYSVVLRNVGFSFGDVAVKGAVGGAFSSPRPKFTPRCVCCDAETMATVPYSIDTDRVQGEPVPVPACVPCAAHLDHSTVGAQLAASGLCVSIGLGGLAILRLAVLAIPAAILGAIAVGYLLRKRAQRRRRAADGHFTGLEVMVHPGQCLVRTTNPRVAAELAARHADELHRATLLERA